MGLVSPTNLFLHENMSLLYMTHVLSLFPLPHHHPLKHTLITKAHEHQHIASINCIQLSRTPVQSGPYDSLPQYIK